MELRPITYELLNYCTHTTFCTNCIYRAGCPIRHSFYSFSDEMEFEIYLQSVELKALRDIGEEQAFLGTVHIRNKYQLEKRNNKFFSYT